MVLPFLFNCDNVSHLLAEWYCIDYWQMSRNIDFLHSLILKDKKYRYKYSYSPICFEAITDCVMKNLVKNSEQNLCRHLTRPPMWNIIVLSILLDMEKYFVSIMSLSIPHWILFHPNSMPLHSHAEMACICH